MQTFDRGTPTPEGEDAGLRIFSTVLEATEPAQQWLTLRPRMIGKNTFAIGAIVRLEVTYEDGFERIMSRLITAGESFVTQEPYEAHFGLGNQNPLKPRTVSEVCATIEWPGTDQAPTRVDVPLDQLDQVLTVGWCGPTDLAAPYGTLDQADIDQLNTLHDDGIRWSTTCPTAPSTPST